MTPTWVTAFLDHSAADHDTATAFWAAVTGYDVSPARGAAGEFATLVPPAGESHLRVQRLAEGASRMHLDLHVADPASAAVEAEGLGATVLHRPEQGYVVLASPGGFSFCLVAHPGGERAQPVTWPGGHSSVVDQVCLDIPPAVYDEECAFWQAVTGWELRPTAFDELRHLVRPAGQPLRFLLQRIDEGSVGAHLDLATSDRDAETARHEALGARVTYVGRTWTVLTDPTGSPYCVTDRDPETGLLP